MQQISKSTDSFVRKFIINRISGIPGGVSLVLTTLVSGLVVPEATPLSAPSSGKRTICKQAQVLTGSTTTVKKITTGTHHFKQGDFLCTKQAGIAYAITSITTSNGVDDVTVGTAIEATAAGDWVYEAAAQSASNTSTFKNIPDAILETAFVVPTASSQVIWMAEGLLRADVEEACIGPLYLALLPMIKELKY